MQKFTAKQQKFIQLKRQGYSNEKAALGAGYAKASAKNQATMMLRRPEIRAACKITKSARASKAEIEVAVLGNSADASSLMPKRKYTDPKEFLRDLMNNEGVPMLMRKDAAKDLMPYIHARVGEKGKKESEKDEAGKIANSKSKFATQRAPSNVTPFRRAG